MKVKTVLSVAALVALSLPTKITASQYPLFSHNHKKAYIRVAGGTGNYCFIDHRDVTMGTTNLNAQSQLTDYLTRNNLTFPLSQTDIEYTYFYTPSEAKLRRIGDNAIVIMVFNRETSLYEATMALYKTMNKKTIYTQTKWIDPNSNEPAVVDTRAKLEAYMTANGIT